MRQLGNLRETLLGMFQSDELRLAGLVTDEGADIDANLNGLADSLTFYARHPYTPPLQFTAVGGKKVLRDEVYGGLSGVFRADHHYYRKHGLYDFPHKRYLVRVFAGFIRLGMKISRVCKHIQQNMKDYMLTSYQKVLK